MSYLTLLCHAPGDAEHLVRCYCEICERYSRAVREPTEAEKQRVRERCGDPHAIVYPDPPYGWDRGCPRCNPKARPVKEAHYGA